MIDYIGKPTDTAIAAASQFLNFTNAEKSAKAYKKNIGVPTMQIFRQLLKHRNSDESDHHTFTQNSGIPLIRVRCGIFRNGYK